MPGDPRSVIETAFAEAGVTSRMDGSVHHVFPVAIPKAEGEALGAWVRHEGANRTIEVGLGYGISTLFIAEALIEVGEDAHHVAIDPHQQSRFAACGLQLLEDAGVRSIVEWIAEDSMLALPELLRQGRSFDFAFIDGNHRFDGVLVDLMYMARLVKGGGIIFVDDYQLPGVARAVSFCTRNLGWSVEETSPHDELHEWAVVRTPLHPKDRAFDYFVDF